MTTLAVQPVSVPALLTKPEAADALRVSSKTLDRMISRGELGACRVGRGVRVSVSELERFLAAAAMTTTPQEA